MDVGGRAGLTQCGENVSVKGDQQGTGVEHKYK